MDRLLRGLDADKAIRVVAAVTTELVREAAQRHGLRGAAAVLLGRGLTAGCLLTTLTKRDDERVRIAMHADGPLGRVLVDAHGDGRARGCFLTERASKVHVHVGPGRASLGALVGDGQITVTRDMGLEHTYQGVVALRSGELDEDLERYLSDSEQLPSVLRCHVEVDPDGEVVRAAGVLGQTFPGSEPERLDRLRAALGGQGPGRPTGRPHGSAGTDGLADVLRHDRSPAELMSHALGAEEFHTMEEPLALRFACQCGRQRALAVVSTLGAEDIDALADERGGTNVRCNYCGDSYALSETDLRELAEQLRALREQRS